VSRSPRVLIIVQNLPVPFDRRVWLECCTLRDAGYDVTVICPRGKEVPTVHVVDGVRIFGYPQYAPGGGAKGYLLEYSYSFLATFALALRARLRGRFDVIQACNPPDMFWPLARWFRTWDRTRFVFDHHDLCPELFESRFERGSQVMMRTLLYLERATFRTADHVISTNGSYRDIALRRGGKTAEQVSVVRTGPDPDLMKAAEPAPATRRGRAHLVAYLGVMGPQDGVDGVLAVADHVVRTLGRTDISFTLMGSGDCYEGLVRERDRLGLQDYVELPGRVSDAYVNDVLSTADVGVCPDPLNPLNNLSTMNKTMEYMAFGVPVVAYDLVETRVSADAAAAYADPAGGSEEFAEQLVGLIDSPGARSVMGRFGRERIESRLAWKHQAPKYLAVYDKLTGHVVRTPATHRAVAAEVAYHRHRAWQPTAATMAASDSAPAGLRRRAKR
jgi:glycosyltransferase involved in cell wall biosynthesis